MDESVTVATPGQSVAPKGKTLPIRTTGGQFSYSAPFGPKIPHGVRAVVPKMTAATYGTGYKTGRVKWAGIWDAGQKVFARLGGNKARRLINPIQHKPVTAPQQVPFSHTTVPTPTGSTYANPALSQRQSILRGLKPNFGPGLQPLNTGMGALQGYMWGDDTGVGGIPGALAGAAALRSGRGMLGFKSVMRPSIYGSTAGNIVDQGAALAGYDTGGVGGTVGAYAGGTAGLSRLLGGRLRALPGAVGSRSGQVADQATNVTRRINQFGLGLGDFPIAAGRAVMRGAGAKSLTSNPVSTAQAAGRLAGAGVLGGTAAAAGYGLLANNVANQLTDGVGNVAQAVNESNIIPQMAHRFTDEAGRRAVDIAPDVAAGIPREMWHRMKGFVTGRPESSGFSYGGSSTPPITSQLEQLQALGSALNNRGGAGVPFRDELSFQG